MGNDRFVSTYNRYSIEAKPAPDLVRWPSRFKVRVKKLGLARLLLKETLQYRGDPSVVLDRPCLYGVFSGPFGGFSPRDDRCVGCLRCTTQYPEFVQVLHNVERQQLGDSFFTFQHVDTVSYEASTGSIPVKGAGYRGKFAGEGWDAMWTDMSEIVRPTRDGIHGREFISTSVDIGPRGGFLVFNRNGQPVESALRTISLPTPILFDRPVRSISSLTYRSILAEAARATQTLAVLPIREILSDDFGKGSSPGIHIVPLLEPGDASSLAQLPYNPQLIQLAAWDVDLLHAVREQFPESVVCLRLPFDAKDELLRYVDAGVGVFHLTADFHGRGLAGDFVFDLIRSAHNILVEARRRDEVTLMGSGGIIAAEHVAKAIIAGLDAVLIDTPLLVALQAQFHGELRSPTQGSCELPGGIHLDWGVQRLTNLMVAWRDQLLEVMGAMGLREVRRLRGEMGRALFHEDLERQAFAGIDGYPV